jgi:hypothetical protein
VPTVDDREHRVRFGVAESASGQAGGALADRNGTLLTENSPPTSPTVPRLIVINVALLTAGARSSNAFTLSLTSPCARRLRIETHCTLVAW